MRGDLEQARALAERSHETLEDLGLRLRAAFAAETLGFIEHLADDHEAAERALLAGFSVANELGEQGYTSTVAALLSRELAEQGRLDEADAMIETSSALGAEDDLTTQALWRAAKALVLSLRGSDEEAERYAREAVEIAAETEDLNMRADVLVQLGAVAAARDRGAAVRALTAALDLYRAKGNVTSAAEAERRVAALRARRDRHALPGPG
jgi:tellurite resistance protein